MNNLTLGKLGLLVIGLLIVKVSFCQNLETMFIEKMDGTSLVFPEECSPEDLVIVINSSLNELKFESNMLPVGAFKVIYNSKDNQYYICHEKIKFKLTVTGPNLQSEDIDIFDIDKPQAYRISANTAKGKVTILTNPRNSTVIFPGLNNLVLSTNQPITNVSGKYRVNIVKAQYKNVDTTIVIPRDAEKTYNIDLIPLFSRIKLDIKTEDNSPLLKAPVLWVDTVKIVLDALVKPGMNQRMFFDDVEFLKFYEGNIVPLAEGKHKIRIEAESYIPYETTIEAKNGKLHTVSANLEPIFGYLTFVDKQFAEGATVYVNNQKVGNVPMFKVKTRVGIHKVKFEKPGYIPLSEEITVTIEENKITDVDVAMQVARKINFQTTPQNAEVLMNGRRIGFTPVTTVINAGSHDILIKKSGFASEKISKLIDEKTPEEENIKLDLRAVNPLSITSEKEGLLVNISGKNENQNIAIEEKYVTPASIPLPYGKYNISLSDGKKIVYKSHINHIQQITQRGKLPNYSRSSFHLLEANINLSQNSNNLTSARSFNDIYDFDASFGRIHLFPKSGLSTALLSVDYKRIDTDSIDFKAIAPSIFLLNWDWRIGGSVLRQLDVNLLGRFKYTPGLKFIGANIPGIADMEMLSYFYGFEISTRLSYFNINFKSGMQVFHTSKLNYWDKANSKYEYKNELGTFVKDGIDLTNEPLFKKQWTSTIGISFNGKVHGANHMLRLWNKPLLDPAKRKTRIKNEETDSQFKKDLFSKLKFWEKTPKTN
jgi:hypothetical protein